MVGETPPYDSDERDDLAALDFSPAEETSGDSDLDALSGYAPEEYEEDALPVPVFTVTNPPGTVTVTALHGRPGEADRPIAEGHDMTETDLADEIVVIAGLATQDARVGPVRVHARGHARTGSRRCRHP